ncbi:DMT family transporter [Candidimonas humi]|uniref:DMT family transporter n=1 Tax=Candidimonas humi TaxID=683355 RepID=A0ABV8NWV6_9BURK
MGPNSPDRSAFALMGLTVLLWSFSWVVMKQLSHLIGPFDLVALRYAIGFLALLAILLVLRQPLRCPPFWLTVGTAVFQTTAFQCLAQFALVAGGAGHVVMLSYTMPFWVLLFAWALLGERPALAHMIGFVLAAAGLVCVIAPWRGLGGILSSLLALAGGASWGVGVVLSKRLFLRHKVNVMTLTAWQMLLGALFTLPLALWMPQISPQWGAQLVLGLLYMGVLASAVGWALWMSVVRRVSATVAGMSALGVPVLTIILAWLLLNEHPTALDISGAALMMAGLVVVTLAPSRAAR